MCPRFKIEDGKMVQPGLKFAANALLDLALPPAENQGGNPYHRRKRSIRGGTQGAKGADKCVPIASYFTTKQADTPHSRLQRCTQRCWTPAGVSPQGWGAVVVAAGSQPPQEGQPGGGKPSAHSRGGEQAASHRTACTDGKWQGVAQKEGKCHMTTPPSCAIWRSGSSSAHCTVRCSGCQTGAPN